MILLPFPGGFVYLIARGRGMRERETKLAQQNEEEFRSYVRPGAAGTGGHAEELSRLDELKNRGDITKAEFPQATDKVLTG
ncbi:hypothetical protein [Streptomyces sp. NPDC002467]|uniref:hypothetical protein n=1 Tax=Streptomyces sp. NPDC002467 TaxID=3364647 RepID=UPI0036B0BDD9